MWKHLPKFLNSRHKNVHQREFLLNKRCYKIGTSWIPWFFLELANGPKVLRTPFENVMLCYWFPSLAAWLMRNNLNNANDIVTCPKGTFTPRENIFIFERDEIMPLRSKGQNKPTRLPLNLNSPLHSITLMGYFIPSQLRYPLVWMYPKG